MADAAPGLTMESNWPIVLIEGVLVLGGALLFGWWQLRSVRKDQQKARAEREKAASADGSPRGAPEVAAERSAGRDGGPTAKRPGP